MVRHRSNYNQYANYNRTLTTQSHIATRRGGGEFERVTRSNKYKQLVSPLTTKASKKLGRLRKTIAAAKQKHIEKVLERENVSSTNIHGMKESKPDHNQNVVQY